LSNKEKEKNLRKKKERNHVFYGQSFSPQKRND